MRTNLLYNLYASNSRKGELRAEANKIYLHDVIVGSEIEAQWWGGISAEGFSRMISTMTGPVEVSIDSPGGAVFGGRAIAAAIRDYPGEVTCKIVGLAASIASIIAIAGDKVIAAPGSFMMVHRAWTIMMGDCADMREEAALLEKIDDSLAASYASKSGGTADMWIAAMDETTWYSADDALAAGLVDEVIDEKSPKNGIDWDLSAFKQQPSPSAVMPPPPAADEGEDEPKSEPVETGRNDQEEEAGAHSSAGDEIAARQRRLAAELLLSPA